MINVISVPVKTLVLASSSSCLNKEKKKRCFSDDFETVHDNNTSQFSQAFHVHTCSGDPE